MKYSEPSRKTISIVFLNNFYNIFKVIILDFIGSIIGMSKSKHQKVTFVILSSFSDDTKSWLMLASFFPHASWRKSNADRAMIYVQLWDSIPAT